MNSLFSSIMNFNPMASIKGINLNNNASDMASNFSKSLLGMQDRSSSGDSFGGMFNLFGSSNSNPMLSFFSGGIGANSLSDNQQDVSSSNDASQTQFSDNTVAVPDSGLIARSMRIRHHRCNNDNNNYGNNNSSNNSGTDNSALLQIVSTLLQQVMTMCMTMMTQQQTPSYPPIPPQPQYPTYPSNPSYPTYPTYPTPTPTPGLKGSAGLVGDPKFMLFTPSLKDDAALAPLKEFESGLQSGQTITALHDEDNGGLQANLTGIQVNPANGNSVGVGDAQFWVGQQSVKFANNGDLLIDGVKKGNINDDGLISSITLANGASISTANKIDDAAGNLKERFVLNNGEYEVTAALRSPHEDSANYYDMNFAEVTDHAADNATGYQVNVDGVGSVGIADLLKLEAQS